SRRIFGDREHLCELAEIPAMQDEIESDGCAPGSEPVEDAELVTVRCRATDLVGRVLTSPLKTELKMIESGREKRIKASFIERQTGSDQVDVEAGGARGLNEFGQVGAGEGVAARKNKLHHASGGGVAEERTRDS